MSAKPAYLTASYACASASPFSSSIVSSKATMRLSTSYLSPETPESAKFAASLLSLIPEILVGAPFKIVLN